MQTEITFTAYYGDETKQVRVYDPVGARGGWHILIDNYYQGSMFKRGDRWVCIPGDSSDLTTDDIMILGEMIDAS